MPTCMISSVLWIIVSALGKSNRIRKSNRLRDFHFLLVTRDHSHAILTIQHCGIRNVSTNPPQDSKCSFSFYYRRRRTWVFSNAGGIKVNVAAICSAKKKKSRYLFSYRERQYVILITDTVSEMSRRLSNWNIDAWYSWRSKRGWSWK